MQERNKRSRKRVVWGATILAVVVVSLLKSFWVEPYGMPKGQMEDKVIAGDQLFVDKWSYGLRLPMTWLKIPATHDSIASIRSYSTLLSLPYKRIGVQAVRRNQIVAFNHPLPPYTSIPIDRSKVLISRCIGVPSDTVSYRKGVLTINHKVVEQSPLRVEAYFLPNSELDRVDNIMQQLGIKQVESSQVESYTIRLLNHQNYEQICMKLGTDSILQPLYDKKSDFSITLPTTDSPTKITAENIGFLYHIMVLYEGVKVEKIGERLYLDGNHLKEYQFKQNYYWMMSDNRALGVDSRHFGAVPHTHLIGEARWLGISIDPEKPFFKAWRPERTFKTIH